ncbi:MAG: putative aminotransferase, StrS family [Actinobacteria bacterium]|nr:putative aminotransferase, StrS family [Actinomycetota bacterium]
MTQTIPQTNPKAGYLARKEKIDEAVARVLDSGWYILGSEVKGFEHEFAAYVGASHAVGVASGTDALCLALRACGVGAGDSVLTVSHTAVATVAAIGLCGAEPVFVDIDPATFTMDPERLREAILRFPGGGLKAVVPVHLYGLPADIPAIREIADRHGIRVIEDCAQSHGASLGGKKTGTFGDIAAFSFYPTKNLGALGDGGIVVTDDAELADRVRLLREYGWRERYVSAIPGTNSRLDELQAAVLRVKLPHLDEDNESRRRFAGLYDALLSDAELTLPRGRPGADHVYHQYVIRLRERDKLKAHLREKGIGTLIHYPVPVHLQPAYAVTTGSKPLLSRTEEIAGEILSLPMYPELGEENVRRVCAEIAGWIRG